MTNIDKNFTYQINDAIEQFSSTSDDDMRWAIADNLVRQFGGTSLCVVASSGASSVNWLRSSMSEEWVNEYLVEKYYEVDPFVLNMPFENKFQIRAPNLLKKGFVESRKLIELNRSLADADYNSLYTGNFNMNFNRDHKLVGIATDMPMEEFAKILSFKHIQHLMAIISAYVAVPHDADLKGVSNFGGNVLSPKEKEVLAWLAAGLQNAAIAEKMNIAEITVRKRLTIIRNKLGAKTRDQALAIAVRDGHFSF
ncbi:MAG: hypothetical protein HRU29_02405 [Rhizobiales bacterium]|nr:LuxR family transcriptional regulator [Hyphomicrobiales bacterium]NRB13230.1 hypothetical protein [Hyphomicrobiales bacterium]